MKKTDSWCTPTMSKNGNIVSGGAARNVRIAAMGGMDEIITQVARNTLELANANVHKNNRSKLRLVSNG
ncbi:hypothetical protein BvCmsKKNP016_01232 [Escherichia coli]|nr:hypothetical protein BvCmsKKNP016_01232 [Escherichia coli]